MHRRTFLQITAVGAATSAASAWSWPVRLFARQDGSPAARSLVAIYLRGGMDALNAIIPHGDKLYYETRPTIAIPPGDDSGGPGVLPLDDTLGLHPSLKSLKGWYDAGRFAPIVNVGSPHTTRSHFDAQDFMEYAAPGSRTVRDGWLNRYLAAARPEGSTLRALAMQGLLPRALRGRHPVLAVPDRKVLNDDKVTGPFEEMYGRAGDDPVAESGRDTLEILERYKKIVVGARERKADYPAGKLGGALRDVAGILHSDAGLEVACADVGGWDHHANETGTIATMLKNLSDSMDAFARDLGDRLDRTLVLAMTEFGRTCRENGNGGTDHGHGGCMFLLGGGVKGGRIHGDWRGLENRALYQGRDLPVTTDFRDVFAEVLRSHLGFETPRGFFPDYAPKGMKDLF